MRLFRVIGVLTGLSILAAFAPACDGKTEDAPKKEAQPTPSKPQTQASATANPMALEPSPEPMTVPEETKSEDHFGSELMDGYTDCYKKLQAFGNIDGTVVAIIGTDGKAESASYSGTAPKPVARCLVDLAKSHTLADYNGERGVATFGWGGMLQGGTEMLSQDWSYKRFADTSAEDRAMYEGPGTPDAEAPAAEAGAAPAAEAPAAEEAPTDEAPAAE